VFALHNARDADVELHREEAPEALWRAIVSDRRVRAEDVHPAAAG
jgi:hypothetical protein